MTMISDLPKDLIEEILSRVPITSPGIVRSTCKGWNTLSNDERFSKKHCAKAAAKELMAIMLDGNRPCLTSVDLHNHKGLVNPSSKEIMGKVEIFKFFHCDGLLLCVPRDNTWGLLVWNPYLGQVRWILPINNMNKFRNYAIGYDNNKNQKISAMFYNYRNLECKIYDLRSDSWRVLGGTPNLYIRYHCDGISLKGNTYFAAGDSSEVNMETFLLCLDFTQEKFVPRLHFPAHSYVIHDVMVLSTVREEQLALLFQRKATNVIEIWITTEIEPSVVSWRFFLKFDMKMPIGGLFWFEDGTFFVEEKHKVVVSWGIDLNHRSCNKAYVIGEDGYYKEMDLGKSVSMPKGCSYVPSSVQIQGLRSSRYLSKSKG